MTSPSTNIAFLFPGQGAVPESPVIDFFGTAVETTYNKFASPETPPLHNFQQSSIESDESAQLGVFNLTLAMALEARDYCTPNIITGYSSGLYAAMVACGCLSHVQGNNAIELAYRGVKRAKKSTIMVGVIGLGFAKVEQILRELHTAGHLSLVNNKSQVIVSIARAELPSFTESCLDAGALNIIPLPFTYPYHVPELASTSRELENYFLSLHLPPMLIPIVTGTEPEFIQNNSARVSSLVAAQLYQTVWWYKTIQCLIDHGAETFVVFDPTSTLTRIIRWISRQIKTIGVSSMKDINQLKGL